MATPHVAGVAALYLQANPTASPRRRRRRDRRTRPRTRSVTARAPARRTGCSTRPGRAPSAGRHDAADDVDHLAGERRDGERHRDRLGECERQRRRHPGRASSTGRSSVPTRRRRTRSCGIRRRRRTAATRLRRGPTTQPATSARVPRSPSPSATAGGARLIVNGGFEGPVSSWTPGERVLAAGGSPTPGPATRSSGFYNNANGSVYQTVTILATHPAHLPSGSTSPRASRSRPRTTTSPPKCAARRERCSPRWARTATATRRASARTHRSRSASPPGAGRASASSFEGRPT